MTQEMIDEIQETSFVIHIVLVKNGVEEMAPEGFPVLREGGSTFNWRGDLWKLIFQEEKLGDGESRLLQVCLCWTEQEENRILAEQLKRDQGWPGYAEGEEKTS